MKILHISDIHDDTGALQLVRDFSVNKSIDLVVCSGDLAGPVYTQEDSEALKRSEGLIYNLHSGNGFKGSLEELAKIIPTQKKAPIDAKKLAELYINFIRKAREETTRQYQDMKGIFDSFNIPYFVIPGNWDTRNLVDVFGPRCLHYQGRETVGEIEVVGFGGSPERMTGLLPMDTEVPFSSEMAYAHLIKSDEVDIALTHCPPFGLADKYAVNGRNMGDLGVLSYYFRNRPTAILCGHTHKPDVARDERCSKSYVICAGNLGKSKNYTDGEVVGNHGFFNTVELDDETFFRSSTLYQIQDIEKGISGLKEIGKVEVR